MSIQFLQQIEESRKKALEKGTIIDLRRADIVKGEAQAKAASKIKYSWYQTPTKVGIEIPYVVTNKDDLFVKFEKSRVIIDFPISTGGHYHL